MRYEQRDIQHEDVLMTIQYGTKTRDKVESRFRYYWTGREIYFRTRSLDEQERLWSLVVIVNYDDTIVVTTWCA